MLTQTEKINMKPIKRNQTAIFTMHERNKGKIHNSKLTINSL